MTKVTGIGGIFFKCEDPEQIREWYSAKLGINSDNYGTSFEWRQSQDPGQKGFTVWGPFPHSTGYFNPSKKEYMINFRVDNMKELIEALKEQGVEVVGEIEEFEYGLFAHILDPEGTKIELWEPFDKEYDKIVEARVQS